MIFFLCFDNKGNCTKEALMIPFYVKHPALPIESPNREVANKQPTYLASEVKVSNVDYCAIPELTDRCTD